ncbi:MAG: adenylate/guanylate cyclase domain-containing protein [Alphaproteobacteria bacterium]|nr:adenylate/guanylate cyclase domain-containing protein [Alphaproteobacteria bacterium]
MSGRVQDAIHRHQDASERLIAWTQLGVVSTFGALYALSPKTSDVSPWMTPVFLTLAIYFSFTMFRLWLSFRVRLPGWFLATSVIADMALLMTLIWSFHVQYDQLPSFYLKAPTLLYVFIFIALRALRFEARYVVLAGVTAALGWAALVFYVVKIDPENPMITRNYVDYMTSNSVLLGAEFDKIISILVVTAVLAVALSRARKLLESSIVEAAAHQDLSRFFSPEIALKITSSDQRVKPGEGEAREAAILNVDIRGFTALAAKMEPSALIRLLHEYESRMVPVIQNHGGNIDKFLGDGILATFGAVLPSDSYAADSLRAVDELVVVAATWNEERRAAGLDTIEIGMALASGRIIFGAVGDETRLEYTVIGAPVNLSAKLEKHNRVAGTRALATGDLWNHGAEQGYVSSTPRIASPHNIDGVAAPVDVVILAK